MDLDSISQQRTAPPQRSENPHKHLQCRYCHKKGHIRNECRALKRKFQEFLEQEDRGKTDKINAMESPRRHRTPSPTPRSYYTDSDSDEDNKDVFFKRRYSNDFTNDDNHVEKKYLIFEEQNILVK